MRVAEGADYLVGSEQKLIDMGPGGRAALERVESSGIIFPTESIRSPAARAAHGPTSAAEGAARHPADRRRHHWSTRATARSRTDPSCLIAAGAFHAQAERSDSRTPGTLPIRVNEVAPGGRFYPDLKEPKNALAKQYVALLETEGIKLCSPTTRWRKLRNSPRRSTNPAKTSARDAPHHHGKVAEEVSFAGPDLKRRRPSK